MSLATRCPACSTVFRVVRDQLKVSEGWVRCGRCSEVFNAAQRLFELGPEDASAPLPPQPSAAEVHRLPQREPAATAQQRPTDAEMRPAPVAARVAVEAPADDMAVEQLQAEGADESTPDGAAEAPGPSQVPEFVRRADRAARWRHPARRGSLAAVALLLLALLAAQIALHYRDGVAATWPATQPALQAACSLLGCRVQAPRRIGSLNVDSSGLVRMQDSPLYRLSLVVQNKSPTVVRMPAIELALTDGQGQTMARRVLTAAELGNNADSLPAGGDVALQATLDLGERRVAGYTVELFYP